jgi:hypothetical protein
MSDDVSALERGNLSRPVGTTIVYHYDAVDVLLAATNHPGNRVLLIVGWHGYDG